MRALDADSGVGNGALLAAISTSSGGSGYTGVGPALLGGNNLGRSNSGALSPMLASAQPRRRRGDAQP